MHVIITRAMAGIKCNDGYLCIDDIIDYEEISDPATCVALEDGTCTTCANVLNTQKNNYSLFRDNPIKAIFNIDKTIQKNNEFWKVLTEKCGIVRPSTSEQPTPEFYIAEPDYAKLTDDHATIQQRIQQLARDGKIKNVNASAFIAAIYKLAISPSKVDFSSKSEPKPFLTSMFKQILQEEHCSSQLIHEPIELPINIQTFFQQLVDVPESGFAEVVDFLDKKHEACLEAILESCMAILDKSVSKKNAGGNNARNKRNNKKRSCKKRISKRNNRTMRKRGGRIDLSRSYRSMLTSRRSRSRSHSPDRVRLMFHAEQAPQLHQNHQAQEPVVIERWNYKVKCNNGEEHTSAHEYSRREAMIAAREYCRARGGINGRVEYSSSSRSI